ncbi:MAG TPA: trypsin-like serine protease [Oligoflexus sp.]|uniref:trypsin-like serine protease n=1 Tax=Oligoflexus sp. TaxID=1971216 RepID=UPI002D801555|nr:trypsin-like serine protease [Oligoflexus sp.]HET9238533.1 trypsin-like serine protease [Oligoflexus sp.]
MKFKQQMILGSALAFLSAIQACHSKSDSKLDIIGGRPVTNDPEGPALHNVVGLSRDGLSTFCSGSVVAKDMIVTAAHCVDDGRPFSVVFGDPKAVMPRVEVEKVDMYKPYGAAAFPNFDIAWVQLKTPVPQGFEPMEVLRDPSKLKEANEFRLAGYGYEKTGCRDAGCKDELLQTNTALEKYYDTPRLMSLLVFKGSVEQKLGGACNGDSGGPAYAKIDNKWYLIGVTNGVTAYVNPESFANRAVSCEALSDIYTFIGDYVPWLEKRSAQELKRLADRNPDRSDAPFVIKGEKRADDVPEPRTWAEWIEYPYHNEQAWNTVDRLLFDLWAKHRPLLGDDEHVKLWVDPDFSQARVQEITSYELMKSQRDELKYDDQPSDLRPLGSWTGLQEVNVIGDYTSRGLEALSRLPALRKLKLSPGSRRPYGQLNLKPLEKLGPVLEDLKLDDMTPGELKTLAFGSFTQLKNLDFAAQSGYPEAVLDMSGLKNLESLKISSWPYASKISLPQDLALGTLELKLDHKTDLSWLDISAVKSIQTLEIGSEVLSEPAVLRSFHKKGIRKLTVPGSRLTEVDFPAAGFADVQELSVSSNLLASTDFIKNLKVLQKADLRDNPVSLAECPAGVSCTFDRVPNPKKVADFCRNTVDNEDYFYGTTIKALLTDQGFFAVYYDDAICDLLQQSLESSTSVELNGDLTWYLPNGLNYDMRVLKSLVGLKSLKIRNVTLAYADALSELSNLTNLDLNAVKTKDLGFIGKIPKLENLSYAEFPYTTLEALSHPKLKSLMLPSEGLAALNGGRVQTIGDKTELPSLTKLSLRGHPLQDLKGVDRLKALSQLDITGTKVADLSPLNTLIGATVFFGDQYQLDTCPILYGSCQTGTKTLEGATFGADGASLMGSNWKVNQVIPGLGKALRN